MSVTPTSKRIFFRLFDSDARF